MVLPGKGQQKVLKMEAMALREGQRQETTGHVWGQDTDQSGGSRSQGPKAGTQL